jgi:hypothetical protein
MPSDHAIDPDELRYPTPRCAKCNKPMDTVVEILDRPNGEPMKVIRYRCKDCGELPRDDGLSKPD